MRGQIIQRESLVTRVVAVLKQELPRLVHGKWLPGERVLSRQFQVSRTTVRAALAQLQRRKLIRAYPQHGYRILASVRRHKEQTSRIIGCFRESFHTGYEPQLQIMIRDIEYGLNAAGYELKIHTDVHLEGRSRHRRLINMVGANRAACWMLTSVSFETQQWFMKRGIPALVLGSCYPGICLPNLDVDYRAIGRHAASLLWRLGHRQICLLAPRIRLGGYIAGEQGFQTSGLQLSRGALSPKIIYHNGSTGDIRRVLDACLSKMPAPTAFLVVHSFHALTAICYFMSKGIRVPRDVSLVCRDDDEFLECVIPSMARYAVDRGAFARRCVRALIQLATSGYLKPPARWMIARYIGGDTVAPPMSAPRR
ncbi:MAG: substrate-binding domain-containing protein [Kiritimatiellae bacterium]|nr:substrate-binding domain-containing protein [Kiritimatiellia bacterium]